jgi:hypothetical protein
VSTRGYDHLDHVDSLGWKRGMPAPSFSHQGTHLSPHGRNTLDNVDHVDNLESVDQDDHLRHLYPWSVGNMIKFIKMIKGVSS